MDTLLEFTVKDAERYLENSIKNKVKGKLHYNSTIAKFEVCNNGLVLETLEEGKTVCVLNTRTLTKQYGQVKFDYFRCMDLGRGWVIELFDSFVYPYEDLEIEIVKFS